MKTQRYCFIMRTLVWVLPLISCLCVGQTNVYFGNLHAHSVLSDGAATAEEAYDMAKDQGKMDFLSLSEHNHMLTHTEMQTLMATAEAKTTDTFVALFGQEYSYLSQGNHTNIHAYPVRIPASANGKYKQLFGHTLPEYMADEPQVIIVGGFNHPKQIADDYGFTKDYNGVWSDFVADMDPIVQLIAVGKGPADANKKNIVLADDEKMLHRDIGKKRWFEYLAGGMHLAPKFDHDTHSRTHGIRTAGRTAVWIEDDLTKDKLLRALADRHCYATEDWNLEIIATVNDAYLPGDILYDDNANQITVDLTVRDADEPNASYKINIYGNVQGEMPAKISDLTDTIDGDGTKQLVIPVEAGIGMLFVIHVRQTFDDPVNHSANDDAWLAPIWIEPSVTDDDPEDSILFVSSKNSSVYHYPSCKVVEKIKAANLRYHEAEPDTKRLHQNCPW